MGNSRLHDINDEVMEKIGYKPISNAIKPVHIANGLFRKIIQEEYSLSTINIWAKRFKQGKEINSADHIRQNFFHALDEDMTNDEVNEIRGYVEMLLNADNAATPSLKYSTLTISNKSHVGGEVQNEFKIPNFLHRILCTEIGGQVSPAINTVRILLNDETDEISKFISPLTSTIRSKKVESQVVFTDDLSGVELQIRQGMDLLVKNSYENTNKLAFLQRIITFSCFAILYHLSSKILDLNHGSTTTKRLPLVIDSNYGDDTIKITSQESLLLMRLSIENYYEKVLENILVKNYILNSKNDILDHIDEFSFAEQDKGKSLIKEISPHEEMKNLFLGYYNQSENLIESYARAIRIMMFSNVINTSDPSETYMALGTKIGLIFGRTRKRFKPTPEILEIILLSVLEKSDALTLSELGQRIWESYGIIIGANPEEDFERLKENGISEHIPGDLHSSLSLNADYISETFISMGYAKRYADGVIIFSL